METPKQEARGAGALAVDSNTDLLCGWAAIAKRAGFSSTSQFKIHIRGDPRWEAIIHIRGIEVRRGIGRYTKVFAFGSKIDDLLSKTPTIADMRGSSDSRPDQVGPPKRARRKGKTP